MPLISGHGYIILVRQATAYLPGQRCSGPTRQPSSSETCHLLHPVCLRATEKQTQAHAIMPQAVKEGGSPFARSVSEGCISRAQGGRDGWVLDEGVMSPAEESKRRVSPQKLRRCVGSRDPQIWCEARRAF